MMIAPVAVAVGILNAQSANPRPAFEVASIKRNTSGTAGESMHIQRGGRFDVQNMPVRYIIWNAYKVSDYQISGGPAWINSERYDIFAKSDSDSSPDRTVIDRTGLTGIFDFNLEWTPTPVAAPPDGSATSTANDAVGPSIFAALQEQLGLRLESAKGPVEMLVIDHVERPSEN